MGNRWVRCATLALVLISPLWCVAAPQSAPEIVAQVRAHLVPVLDVVCKDHSTIATYYKDSRVNQTRYENVVASPRSANGGTPDRLTAYSERVSVNGQEVPKNSLDSNVSRGATFNDSRTTIFRNSAGNFNFKMAASQPRSELLLEFELKKGGLEIPSHLPDSGKAWINKETFNVNRLEMTYLGRPQSPGPTFQNTESTVVQAFGNVKLDKNSLWMPTESRMDVIQHLNKDLMTRYIHQYADCKKFNVSVTIKP